MLTHAEVLAAGRSSYGSRTAVTFLGTELSYAELDEASTALAHGLLGAGAEPGDRIAWIERNHLDFLLLYYATAKAGMLFAPINPQAAPAEMGAMLDLLAPALVVAGGQSVEFCVRRALRTVDHRDGAAWRSLFTEGGALPPVPEDALHEIVFTSGTTGVPKGVLRSQRKRILDSLTAALAYRLHRDDHMLFFAPQFHVGGSAAAAQMIVQGGRVTLLPRFDPAAIAEAIRSGVTYILGVPAHYRLLIDAGVLGGLDTTAVRGCYLGGSAATSRLFTDIGRAFPCADIVHAYGSTESGPHTLAARGLEFSQRPGTLGLPVPGTEVRVVDPSGSDVPAGAPGELWVRSATLMDGYYGAPDLTAAVLSEGWLRTGDVVRRADDGYFYLVDRLKDMIITGGENVYPAEVEAALARVPGVAEAAVIGVPDPVYEERVVAFVRRGADGSLSAAQLRSALEQSLAPYKIPRIVEFVDDLPRTPVGKVAKAELRQRFGAVRTESEIEGA